MSRTLLDNDAIQNTSIKFEKLNEDITSILNKVKDLTFSTAINSSSTDTEFPSSKAVYTSVNTLSTSINNLNSNISSLNTSLDELKAKVDTNTNNISSNSNSISTINSQIQQINSNISSLSSSITELNTNLDTKFNTCQNNINTVSESLSTYITTHTEEFNTLTTRVNTLGENIASLQVKVTDINNAITALEPYTIIPTYTPVSAEDSFNYTLTNINFSEIHAALVKGKDIKITGVLGDTLIPTTLSYTEDYISITSSGSYSLPFYYIFSIHKNDTSTLNIQQVVTNSLIANTPDNPSSYSDVQVASPLLVDSYNQFLITITSMTLNLVSGYSNVNSGSCTLDKNYTEIKKAIDFHLQLYIKDTNGNILKVVSQYCSNTAHIINLVYYNNQASFIINISGKSSTEPSITSYTIPSVDINIEETSDNPISNKAVYTALTETNTKLSGYLPLSGGTISVTSDEGISINRTNGTRGVLSFKVDGNYKGGLGIDTDGVPFYRTYLGHIHTLIHSGNYNSYALPLSGGTVTGALTINTYIDSSFILDEPTGEKYHKISFRASGKEYAYLLSDNHGSENKLVFNGSTILHSGNVGNYALKTDGSNVMAGAISWNNASVGTNVDTFGEGLIVGKTTDSGTTLDGLGYKYASVLNVSNGAYRFQIASAVANANKLLYRGYDANAKTYFDWKTIAFTDSNVASSSKWATARTITLTGSVTGSVSIDGSNNVTLETTTNHTHSNYVTTDTEQTITALKNFNGLRVGYNSDSLTPPTEYPYIGLSQKQLVIMAPSTSYPSIFLRAGSNLTLQANYDTKLSGQNVKINATNGTIRLEGNEIYLYGNIYLEDSVTAGTLLNRIQTLEAKVAELETAISNITIKQ